MAIGFLDLNGVSRVPDRSFTQAYKPNVLKIQFGDGYEQRIQEGINNIKQTFSVAFNNRPKADIDDIIALFVNKGGTSPFNFTYPDSNAGGGETTVKVVCEEFNQAYAYDGFYSCTATFRRVYEA